MARKPPTQIAVQDDRALTDPATQDQLIQQLVANHVKNVRENAIWGQLRTAGGGYDYSKLDTLVNKLRAKGIHSQLTIMGTPRYMQGADQTLSYQNANPTVLKQFSRDVAQHFKGRVGRYSVWNEPNIDAFLANAQENPKRAGRTYRNLYRAGYAGIKGADPTAQVLLGEMTSAPSAKTFLQSVLAGKTLHTSGLAFHPYDQSPAQTAGSDTWDIDTLNQLQGTLANYKRQGKLQTAQGGTAPLYLTEFGYQRKGNEPQRRALLAAAGRKAQAAGAREMLYYQLLPTPKNPGQSPSGGWDTSIGSNRTGIGNLLGRIGRRR